MQRAFTTNQSGNTTIALDAGGGGVTDVEVNNTSVVSGGVANIDLTGYAQKSGGIFSGNIYAPQVLQESTITPNTYTQCLTAETVNNYSAKTDLSNLSSTSSTNFDGQWRYSGLEFSDATKSSKTIDLSSYLPNDNQIYEVMFVVETSYTSANSYGAVGTVENPLTNIGSNGNFFVKVHATSNARRCEHFGILPVGSSRALYKEIVDAAMSNFTVYFLGFRRVGTNT